MLGSGWQLISASSSSHVTRYNFQRNDDSTLFQNQFWEEGRSRQGLGGGGEKVMADTSKVLLFRQLDSKVEEGFWARYSSFKLNDLGIDDSPLDITGFIAPCSRDGVPETLTLLTESLSSKSNENSSFFEGGNRNRCPIPGTLYNFNTMESFRALDRGTLLKNEMGKIWNDIMSGKVEEEPNILLRFLLISYADLKRWRFHYLFAFPAVDLQPPVEVVSLHSASKYLNSGEAESLSEALNKWRNSNLTSGVPFFLVCITSDSHVTIRHLKDWKETQSENCKVLYGFYDPSNLQTNPGWPLRNFLSFISLRWKVEKICFLCYRESHGLANMELSLVGEALISLSQAWSFPQYVPKAVGWETNMRKLAFKHMSLVESMDPTRVATSAADLNLKLMRWRTLPSLDLNKLSGVKCLLLGAGTLGCQVARMLMAWGIRKITLVDNGRVAMSNPLRQSLYTLDNCLNGGEMKSSAAVKSLKNIFPAVEAEGISLTIPMPGHPILPEETDRVLEECKQLQNLVSSHDAVFLLTDTRESRWLPTLLCANTNKIVITAALGFDSYLVMRHGAGPHCESVVNSEPNIGDDCKNVEAKMENLSISSGGKEPRLGCYFCNDVVAPIDSTSNRTLDQQCTVTRPGLAPIASSLAVELFVGILHHPDGLNAPAEDANSGTHCIDRPLGILPHQIRGSLPQFSQLSLAGKSSDSCTACSSTVVSEYRERNMDFVLHAINHPTYLEDLSGLTELMEKANSCKVDWDEYNTDDDI